MLMWVGLIRKERGLRVFNQARNLLDWQKFLCLFDPEFGRFALELGSLKFVKKNKDSKSLRTPSFAELMAQANIAVKKVAKKDSAADLPPVTKVPAQTKKRVRPVAKPVPVAAVPVIPEKAIRWFFPSEVGEGPQWDKLRDARFTLNDLIEVAVASIKPAVTREQFARYAVSMVAKSVILDAARAEAGAPNASGVADARIGAAYDAAIKAKERLDAGRLKTLASSNQNSVFRWCLLHHPELL